MNSVHIIERPMLVVMWSIFFLGFSLSVDAAQISTQSQADDASNAQEWLLKGEEANRAGNRQEAIHAYEEAADAFKQAISRNPDDAGLWKKLGFAYWQSDHKDQAFAAYKEAVRLDPNDHESHNMLGTIQATNLNASIIEFREAVRLKPDEIKYRLSLGRALAQNDKLDDAMVEFQEAARINPQNGECPAFMGLILQKNGDLEGAISEYRKALSLDLSSFRASSVRAALNEALAFQQPKRKMDSTYWLDKVKEWRTAVEQHDQGKADSSAVLIGSWPINEAAKTLTVVKELTDQLTGSRKRSNTKSQIQQLLNLTDEETQQGNVNRILKRGALLHTDIVILGLETGASGESGFESDLVDRGSGSDVRFAEYIDGHTYILPKEYHLKFARRLLDWISPDPSRDEMVRQWYIATTAYMQNRRNQVHADSNLERALQIFPHDPEFLFYTGALHENYAAPSYQNALMPPGMWGAYRSKETELKIARVYFREVIKMKPGFAEAHLRLGRVLGLLGHHDKAVDELQKASAALTDTHLQYFAALFLGNELSVLRKYAEARDQFERAAKLYPTAQSPLLSLSRLARGKADSQNALSAIQRLFALPRKNPQQDDPWWNYDMAHVRDAGTLMMEMRKAFGGLTK